MKKGIAVVAYNRPEYLAQCIEGIAKNPEARVWDTHFFLDGGPQATQEKNIELIKNGTPRDSHWRIHTEDAHLGIGLLMFKVREEMFSHYFRMFLIEDDFVVGPNYFTLLDNLHTWAQENFDNVVASSLWNECKEDRAWKRAHLREVGISNNNWFGYVMDRKHWLLMREYVELYNKNFLIGREYRTRHSGKIRVFEKALVEKYAAMQWNRTFPRKPGDFWVPAHVTHPTWPSSQDGMMAVATHLVGGVKIVSRVNRAQYIGAMGEHARPGFFAQRGYADVKIDVFTEDTEIKDFICT